MTSQELFRLGLRRLIIVTILSSVLVWFGSEAFYLAQPDEGSRAPNQVELIIPEGTAARIAQGEPVPSIPTELTFVVGDVLVVRNRDVVDHQLGPLWIPAQTSAIYAMDEQKNTVETCSFQPSKYLGLDVRQPTTLTTRIQALLLAGPSTAIFLFLYSFLVFPVKPKQPKGAVTQEYIKGQGDK